jgi:hypothetical protein
LNPTILLFLVPTTMIIVIALSALLVIAIGIIVGIVCTRRLRKEPMQTLTQFTPENNLPGTSNYQQRQQASGEYEMLSHAIQDDNAEGGEDPYNEIDLSKEVPHHCYQDTAF